MVSVHTILLQLMIEWGEWGITERDMRACACLYLFFFFPFVTIKSGYGMKMPDIRRYIQLLLFILLVSVSQSHLGVGINPLTPKSDQHVISPHNIIPESHNKVTKIREMITN